MYHKEATMIRIGRLARFVRGLTIAMTVVVALGITPSFAQTTPDFVLPAGVACSGFDLGINISGGDHQVFKEFQDKNGNVVRTLQAGKGFALTFQNMSTGAQLSLQPNGSVIHTTINPDGSATVAATGHTVLILFPSDVPAGPSTTLYVGRVVYTIDTNGVFTVQQTSGTSSDICASLSS
jgi:hypothetical protein